MARPHLSSGNTMVKPEGLQFPLYKAHGPDGGTFPEYRARKNSRAGANK